MAIDIRLDTITKTGNAHTAYVQFVDAATGKEIETASLNFDPAKKEAFSAAIRAKAADLADRIRTAESVKTEIETILGQVKKDIGG